MCSSFSLMMGRGGWFLGRRCTDTEAMPGCVLAIRMGEYGFGACTLGGNYHAAAQRGQWQLSRPGFLSIIIYDGAASVCCLCAIIPNAAHGSFEQPADP